MENTDSSIPTKPGAGLKPVRSTSWLRSFEGYALLLGSGLAFLWLLGLSLGLVWWPQHAQPLLGMTVSNVIFGRAAGMSIGYAAGYGHAIVMPSNMLIETILVLLVYPLFVLSWRELVTPRFLQKFMTRTRRAAEAHQGTIARYGLLGLFVFVWLPFWMTGPVVGAVIGFFLGLRPWVNLCVVLSGTYLAIVVWALLLSGLQESLAQHTAYGPVLVVLFIIFVVLVRGAWRRRE